MTVLYVIAGTIAVMTGYAHVLFLFVVDESSINSTFPQAKKIILR